MENDDEDDEDDDGTMVLVNRLGLVDIGRFLGLVDPSKGY